MDSETVHGTAWSGVTSVPAGRYSGGQWTLDGSGRSMATGYLCCAPDRLAAVCPKKG
ncbi:hypothetical protein AB6S81_004796 [Escherichia coli]|nr:hypothetical protein [Escherichia coli]EHO3245591.1 hypothetical protein [Escherichia coli]EIT1076220.1 hypothetical protein [Escherichia coli]HDD8922433.1 hypothetical protein [Escherichia coli]HEI2274979.1 hypothetical protein [Escherichia coli]